jgi:hypothetical protein
VRASDTALVARAVWRGTLEGGDCPSVNPSGALVVHDEYTPSISPITPSEAKRDVRDVISHPSREQVWYRREFFLARGTQAAAEDRVARLQHPVDRWKGNVRNGRHIGCRLGDRHLSVHRPGGKVMCDVEQAALAKASGPKTHQRQC